MVILILIMGTTRKENPISPGQLKSLHARNQRQDISGIIRDFFQVILKFKSRILFRANIAHCMSRP